MTTFRRTAAAAAVSLALSSLHLSGAAPAAGAGRWAPEARASITPGVQMYTDRKDSEAQCTANFVFTDSLRRVYVGYAAHCAGLGEATDTNGCTAKSLPLGARVRFARGGTLVGDGETVGRGRLVYSSWVTMQRRGVTKPAVCWYNDFALVRVGRKHVAKVNPTVPFWGGPVGLRKAGTEAGDEVHGYGRSSLRPGSVLSPRTGASLGSRAGGWTHDVYTATPGVPGDSGSGVLDAKGRALGTLSTIQFAPLAGSNGVSHLRHQLRFAQRHSGIDGLRLVQGTRSFQPLP